MKKLNILYVAFAATFIFSSCEDFLNTLPDNRAEIDSEAKITSLLVSAYPQAYPVLMFEMASDNTMDNGSLYSAESQTQEDAYLWNDVVSETDDDSSQGIWDRCYMAIASANHALQAIDQMGNPESLNPQRGEALICRAYGHFILANTFCQAFNPQTAGKTLGIPYAVKPETEVSPTYARGTLAETYENIDADIQAALPLIDDDLYKVTKYHFNKKAAYAFAARFYLFYLKEDKSNYEQVIKYADLVLGKSPAQVLRKYEAELGGFTDLDNKGNAYIAVKSQANLMLSPVNTSWPYVYGPYRLGERYGMAREICETETLWADGVWGGSNTLFYNTLNGSDQKFCFLKYNMYFEYTDKVNGIGYRHAVLTPFTTDETFLCRMEAYVMKAQPDYAKAVSDINDWIVSHGRSGRITTVTEAEVNDYYAGINYMPEIVEKASQRTVKKHLNPPYPFVDDKQENFMHCILQMRRMECIHDGSRWLDIKRYNIVISHNRESISPDVLKKDDPRRAMQLPQDVISAGLEANPRN